MQRAVVRESVLTTYRLPKFLLLLGLLGVIERTAQGEAGHLWRFGLNVIVNLKPLACGLAAGGGVLQDD